MEDIRQVLQQLGLNDKEIDVYLMLLKVGTAPASTLAGRTHIQRSTAQYTCKQLVKKGLVRMIQRGDTHLYTADAPAKIISLLQREQDALKEKEGMVRGIIEKLNGIVNTESVLPKIRFFEGRDGLIQGYNHMLDSVKKGDVILSFLHALEQHKDPYNLYKPLHDVTLALEGRKIRNHIISPQSAYSLAWQKQDVHPYRVTRLTKDAKELPPVEIMMFGNSIFATAAEGDQIFGYLAENKPITEMHRSMFNELWDRLA